MEAILGGFGDAFFVGPARADEVGDSDGVVGGVDAALDEGAEEALERWAIGEVDAVGSGGLEPAAVAVDEGGVGEGEMALVGALEDARGVAGFVAGRAEGVVLGVAVVELG